MPDLFDGHAHLDFDAFDADRVETILRAKDSGIVGVVNVGTSLASSRASIALADRHDFIWASVGIHPHDARHAGLARLTELRTLAQHPKVVAVGEIGLDYYRDLSPRLDQRQAFAAQLRLASDLGKPVIVHSRDAHEDVADILEGFSGTVVLHSYSAGSARLQEALDSGFYISISGPVTFRNAHDLRQVAAAVPLDRLLVETDCPFLAPEPMRGRRNEPAFVRHVAGAVAMARHTAPHILAQAVVTNARRVFGIS